MSTRALILHEQGAIWKKHDGYATGLGREIFDFCEGYCDYLNIGDFYKYLSKNDIVKFCELDMPLDEFIRGTKESENSKLAELDMYDAEYIYLILGDDLYVKGELTKEEQLVNKINNKKVNTFRRLVLKNRLMYFVDTDGKIKKVTK